MRLALVWLLLASPAQAQRPANIVVRDGRAMQVFGGNDRSAAAYGAALNELHAMVGDRAALYAMLVPSAQEFYAGSEARERANISAAYAALDPAIRRVDAYSELAAHTSEPLYFRTDHHLTGLGGYYGYRAFCTAAGLTPSALDHLEHRVVREHWGGSMLRYDPTLRPEAIEVLVPPIETEVRAQRQSDEPEHEWSLFREDAGGYSVFLGGDLALMRVHSSVHNGRRAIVIKNSHGNAFAVQLVAHYEELVFLDYRTFRGDLVDLLASSSMPTDLVVIMGTLTANSHVHLHRLLAMMHPR